jgi:DNA (cytosine-5)-methyltransferase 1
MTVTTAHLCSGYDGLGRGLTLLAPHRTLWHAEIDADMSATLAKHEPDVVNVGDLIALVLGDLWRLAPVPDVLTAGFPCQPVSAAGRQLAELDHRWLWPFIIEIIRTVGPQAVLLENVQNIVSIQGGAVLRGILADLRAAGYAARWTVVGACAVGAPHHRHRWYLWAWKVGGGAAPEAVRVGTSAFCGAPRSGGRYLLPTPNARDGGPLRPPSRAHAQRRADNPMRSLNLDDAIALLPTPMVSDVNGPGRATKQGGDDLRTVVAALLPTPLVRDADGRGEGDQAYWDRRGRKPDNLGAVATLLPTPLAASVANGGPNQRGSRGDLRMPSACQPERWGKYAEAVALWEQITGISAPEPTEPNSSGNGRRMSALLPEWMMGLPTGLLTGHLPRAAAIKGAGNGVVPLQAAAAQRLLAGQS